MLGGDRVSGADRHGPGSEGHVVDLEGAGDVDLTHPVEEPDTDRRPKPRDEGVESDGNVRGGEGLDGHLRCRGYLPTRVFHQPADSSGFDGTGHVLHDFQGAGDAGGYAGRGGYPAVLNESQTSHPMDLGMTLLEGTQTGPVAGRLMPVQEPGPGKDARSVADARTRTRRPDCSTIHSRIAASSGPSGAPTAGTTTTSGCRALPELMSSNVYVGTIAGPPSIGAGADCAAIVYTEKSGELENTSYGARTSLPTVPDEPSTTATTIGPEEKGRFVGSSFGP